MFDFFVGMLVGMIVIDLLWAWEFGLLEKVAQWVSMKWKLFKARKI
jgi:hypothetical protein